MNENAKKWVAALRSGKYKQGRSYLKRVDDGEARYCCLGVACELFTSPSKTLAHPDKRICMFGNGASAVLPEDVQAMLGLADPLGYTPALETSLSRKNDAECLTFDQIADFIESEPEGLFAKESDNG